MIYSLYLLSCINLTLQIRRRHRSGKIHALFSSMPERITNWNFNWVAFIWMEMDWKRSIPIATFLGMVGAMSDVMIYELSHLHYKYCSYTIFSYLTAGVLGQSCANFSCWRKVKSILGYSWSSYCSSSIFWFYSLKQYFC